MYCYLANAQVMLFFYVCYFVFLCDLCIPYLKTDALLCGECAGRRFFPMFIILFICVMCVFHVRILMHCCVFFNSVSANHMIALLQRTKRNSFFAARRRESQLRTNDARGCCCNRNHQGNTPDARGCVLHCKSSRLNSGAKIAWQ